MGAYWTRPRPYRGPRSTATSLCTPAIERSCMKKTAAASIFVRLGLVTVLASSAAPLHAQTPDGGDPPDSGYQSTFLSTLNKTNVTEAQATMARAESVRESRGNVQGFAAR